jgi:adenylylsulfate reductase subunit B
MPSYVITSKCDGCKAQDRTACQYICPNDLMVLDRQKMKAYNRDPAMCWECFNCVKLCPTQAIEVRGYSDFVPMGASVSALRSTEDIMWTVQFRNPEIKPKRFKFPIRRGVGEGQIKPFGHFETGTNDLASPVLMGEPSGLNTAQGPVKLTGLAPLALTRTQNGGK